jgi:hypothetical protein
MEAADRPRGRSCITAWRPSCRRTDRRKRRAEAVNDEGSRDDESWFSWRSMPVEVWWLIGFMVFTAQGAVSHNCTVWGAGLGLTYAAWRGGCLAYYGAEAPVPKRAKSWSEVPGLIPWQDRIGGVLFIAAMVGMFWPAT